MREVRVFKVQVSRVLPGRRAPVAVGDVVVVVSWPVGVGDGEVGPLAAVGVLASVEQLLIVDVAEYGVPSLNDKTNLIFYLIAHVLLCYVPQDSRSW